MDTLGTGAATGRRFRWLHGECPYPCPGHYRYILGDGWMELPAAGLGCGRDSTYRRLVAVEGRAEIYANVTDIV